jgi:hypothetical protein
MATVVSDTRVYPIGPAETVRLAVEIGNGQAGGTSVLFRGRITEIPGDGSADFGSAGDVLRFGILHCVTNVKDVNEATNRTSVRYTLAGGAEDQRFDYAVEVPAEGEWAQYTVDFVFA